MLFHQHPRALFSAVEAIRPALRFTYNLRLPRLTWYEPVKGALDLLGGSLLLIATSPLILFGALLVKLTSRGPAFYTQTRLGRHGKLFTIYKLRTMTHNCEKASGVRWSTKGDPRVTAVGRFLRATKIDELPQFWNVILGDMSLIGPRPERPEFLPQLEEALPFYRCRLMVRPGLTGLAQVQLASPTVIWRAYVGSWPMTSTTFAITSSSWTCRFWWQPSAISPRFRRPGCELRCNCPVARFSNTITNSRSSPKRPGSRRRCESPSQPNRRPISCWKQQQAKS